MYPFLIVCARHPHDRSWRDAPPGRALTRRFMGHPPEIWHAEIFLKLSEELKILSLMY